jgi:hypothetical protein
MLAENREKSTNVRIGEFNGEPVTVNIKNRLTAAELAQFVSDMTDAEYFKDKDGNEFYRPAYGVILFSINTVKYYTDVKLPKDVENAYEFIKTLRLDDAVENHLIDLAFGDESQFCGLKNAIAKAQEDFRMQRIGLNGLLGSLKNVFGEFGMDKIKEITGSLEGLDPGQTESLKEPVKTLTESAGSHAIV